MCRESLRDLCQSIELTQSPWKRLTNSSLTFTNLISSWKLWCGQRSYPPSTLSGTVWFCWQENKNISCCFSHLKSTVYQHLVAFSYSLCLWWYGLHTGSKSACLDKEWMPGKVMQTSLSSSVSLLPLVQHRFGSRRGVFCTIIHCTWKNQSRGVCSN